MNVSRIPYPVSRERGAILLMVLIVILTISLLGATLMALFYNVLTSSSLELDKVKALYLAEAGISQAVSLLKSRAGEIGSLDINRSQQIIAPTQLGEGFFEVHNDIAQSTIVSVGESNGIKRTIQLRYNAF